MTNEFKEKMNKAMENGILIARKQDKEYLEKVKFNQQYADLYMELVLAFVGIYDFCADLFNSNLINKDFLKKFGNPKDVFACIIEEKQTGIISLDYGNESNGWLRAGEPEFKKLAGFDLDVINDILGENDISVHEDHVDGGGYGSNCDYIYFDASMLIETRKKLLEEASISSKKRYKKKD